MGLIACFLLVAAPGTLLLSWWGGRLFTGRWRTPGWLLATTGLCVVAAAGTWFIGALSGGLDPEEACHAVGATYDRDYRSAHWREPSRWFPMHNRCNAEHDLVPVWVNPGVVILLLAATTCLAGAVWLTVASRQARR